MLSGFPSLSLLWDWGLKTISGMGIGAHVYHTYPCLTYHLCMDLPSQLPVHTYHTDGPSPYAFTFD